MCYYSERMRNPKYEPNKKNDGVIPVVSDTRTLHIEKKCGNCRACRLEKARDWKIRLMEDIKYHKGAKFITLTFSTQALQKINKLCIEKTDRRTGIKHEIKINDLKGYEKDNAIAKKATRLFLERWRKVYKKSVRHWLITELGHKNTEHVHLHGIIYAGNQLEQVRNIWQYGYVWDGDWEYGRKINYVSNKTINYMTKYVTKVDLQHKAYRPIILTTNGIGREYIYSHEAQRHKYNGIDTDETYRTLEGYKIMLPKYYKDKLYTDEQREKLWIHKIDEQVKYIHGIKISTKTEEGERDYYRMLIEAMMNNRELGYGNRYTNHARWKYETERRNAIHESRGLIQSIKEINNNNNKRPDKWDSGTGYTYKPYEGEAWKMGIIQKDYTEIQQWIPFGDW